MPSGCRYPCLLIVTVEAIGVRAARPAKPEDLSQAILPRIVDLAPIEKWEDHQHKENTNNGPSINGILKGLSQLGGVGLALEEALFLFFEGLLLFLDCPLLVPPLPLGLSIFIIVFGATLQNILVDLDDPDQTD